MESKPSAVPVRSVKKALDLLDQLVFHTPSGGGVTLTALARHLGSPANTTRNLLKTMIVCGYVAQREDATYMPGPKCLEMGRWNALAADGARERIDKLTRDLSERLREAVVLAALRDGRRVVLARCESNRAVRVESRDIPEANIYSVATGRVLAAYATADDLARIVSHNGLPGAHWDGIGTEAALRHALADLRRKGYCLDLPDHGETVAMAVPVFDPAGKLRAALGCYAPCFRCPRSGYAAMIREMKSTVRLLAGCFAS